MLLSRVDVFLLIYYKCHICFMVMIVKDGLSLS